MPQFRIAEAARLLGVSDDTVRRWVDAGTLPATTDAANRKVVDGAVRSSEAVRELGLEPGSLAVAVIKSTNVVVEIPGGSS